MDIKIDKNRELVLTSAGDLALVQGDRDKIIQEINIRLAFFYSEWFLDVTQGVPYLEVILKKGTSVQTVNGIFIKEINAVEGVNEILDFKTTFDGDTRVYRLDFKLDTIFGIVENGLGVEI